VVFSATSSTPLTVWAGVRMDVSISMDSVVQGIDILLITVLYIVFIYG
jgi:hypothetical protein